MIQILILLKKTYKLMRMNNHQIKKKQRRLKNLKKIKSKKNPKSYEKVIKRNKKKIVILMSRMKNLGILCLMIKLRAVKKMKMMNRLKLGLNKKEVYFI